MRLHPLTADVIHLHRSGVSYGKPINYSVEFRIHLSIRSLNDRRDRLALNGPDSERFIVSGGYHLRFNARSGSTYERCIEDLSRFVTEQADPWFLRFRDGEALLSEADSPLGADEKESLRAAIDGHLDAEAVRRSMEILGIKKSSGARAGRSAGSS